VSEDRAIEEIDEARQRYVELTGLPIIHFRAPYGDRCKRLEKLLDERNHPHLHWDIDPREWLHRSSKHASTYVIRKLKRLDGRAVILMHDTKKATAKALPVILDWIDEENRRRAANGRAQIKILPPSALVEEQMHPKAQEIAVASGTAAWNRFNGALARLVPGMRTPMLSQR
jgi:peptidoglycan/xylan/chitin deacetylase (PgdA/CDA1 family)